MFGSLTCSSYVLVAILNSFRFYVYRGSYVTIVPCQVKIFQLWEGMEKYPYLNAAVATVLSKRRAKLGLSKRKLSELAMIERAYISSLEAGTKSPTLNVLFYLSEALGLTPDEFVLEVISEVNRLAEEQKSPPLRRT